MCERIRKLGGIAYKFTSPARRSVPDRIILMPHNRIYFVECKRPGNKATKLQEMEHDKLRNLGFDVSVISTMEEIESFIQRITNA